jgi:outer membrane protein OmpA-like peptidoglycan-associated protein
VRCSFDADALFEPGAATLTDVAVAELSALAAELGDDVRAVTVEGRTDHRGDDADNLTLSEARAAAAASALIDGGIDETLISVVGLGEADARQPGNGSSPTAGEMAADRRVDVVIDADVAPTNCAGPSGPAAATRT